MPTFRLTRRVALAAAGAAILAVAVAAPGAIARARISPPGIHVDVGPLRENAGEPTASWVAEALPGQLAQDLAGRMASANVSVRIDYLTLGPSTGGIGPAGSSIDTIQGVATINGVEMPVRATNSYYPSPVDQTMIERTNRLRVTQLSQALACWIAQDAAR